MDFGIIMDFDKKICSFQLEEDSHIFWGFLEETGTEVVNPCNESPRGDAWREVKWSFP